MVTPIQAHEQMVAANPAPVRTVERPAAAEFLAEAEGDVIWLRDLSPERRWMTRGPLAAVTIFLIVAALGVLIAVLSSSRSQVVDTVPVPTSLVVPTTVELTSEAQQMAHLLAAAYSSGDFESVTAYLADGTSYGWSRASDFVSGPVQWTDAEFRARYEIGVALNTTITLTECQDLDENRVSCAILRLDDLVRGQRLDPSKDVRWRLAVEDGLIADWVEHTPDISIYYDKVIRPFRRWLNETHPEIEDPLTDLEGQPWRADTDFAEIAPDLVAEYTASLGVTLDR